MDWSPIQAQALDKAAAWLRDHRSPQVFRLFGYAGTGKTTLAKHLAEQSGGRVQFAAYTGKAASVMQRNGCYGASTIHQLIYLPSSKSQSQLTKLKAELLKLSEEVPREEQEDHALMKKIRHAIHIEQERLKQPAFNLNPDSILHDSDLVIIDECSMVDRAMGEDLLSFGKKILVLGDTAQLPPFRGAGFFVNDAPDIELTEIHRQAEGNPIIELATKVRLGEPLPPGRYGESEVIPTDQKFDQNTVVNSDQVLVGTNKLRRMTNTRLRQLLGKDYETPYPQKGDKLICLRNNRDAGLLNGTMWDATAVRSMPENDKIDMTITNGQISMDVVAHPQFFTGTEDSIPFYEMRDANSFDFGYAITTHKAQGSQWPHVCIVDESRCFRGSSQEWLYTAITRAAERVTIKL